jgi:hypothetical protein
MFEYQRKCFAGNGEVIIQISDQAKGDNVNSTLIRQKTKRIFDNQKAR